MADSLCCRTEADTALWSNCILIIFFNRHWVGETLLSAASTIQRRTLTVVARAAFTVYHELGLPRGHSGEESHRPTPEMQETRATFLARKDPLEEEIATHSSILACKIPWTEQRGRLQSMGLQRLRHDWVTEHAHTGALRQQKFTPSQFWRLKIQNQDVCRTVLTLKALEKSPFLHLLWHSLAVPKSSHGLLPSVHLSLFRFPSSYKDTGHYVMFYPNPSWPDFNLILSPKTLFPNNVGFSGSRWTWILGEHYSIQHTLLAISFSLTLIR